MERYQGTDVEIYQGDVEIYQGWPVSGYCDEEIYQGWKGVRVLWQGDISRLERCQGSVTRRYIKVGKVSGYCDVEIYQGWKGVRVL